MRITAVPPGRPWTAALAGRPWTAASTSAPAGPVVVKLLAVVAAFVTAAVWAAGGPISWPLGMKTVTVVPPLPAFASSTVALSVSVGSVATSGARFCASAVALLTAWFAAKLRSTSASGTRKETSTSELVATTSRMTRSLIRAR